MGATWISWAELAGLIGNDATQALCSTLGGVSLYVPMQADASGDLARIIGVPALRKLVEVYGGDMIAVPNRRKEGPRKGKILDMLDRGMAARDIALSLDVTQRYVEYLAKSARPGARQGSLLDM
ncbi:MULTISPECIES: RNA helicase [unclassified Desulfovibrio]|uniref:RNA helicase n=1 Tax=unclassified Desulfovibrio TaxID=2593640 RepID=UPI0013EB6D7D|nr:MULTISPECIES: RNA helicase [unclassified Desulfovibrio]